MPLYLAPYIGSGTRVDPWRPLGSDQPGWSAIRLLAQGETSATSRCLLWLPIADANAQLDKLGDELDGEVMSPLTKARLRSALRITGQLLATTTVGVIAELLVNPPVNGWNALRPSSRTGRAEVVLDKKVIWQSPPAISGGASATEDFAAALDTNKWAIGEGDRNDLESVSGRLRATTDANDGAIRLITPLIGGDQYSQAKTYLTGGPGVNAWAGCSVRMQSGTDESEYTAMFVEDSSSNVFKRIFEVNSSNSYTTLVTDSTGVSFTDGDVLRTEAEGSTIRQTQNGADELSTTDTTLATGQPGLNMYGSPNPFDGVEMDDWEGGDLGAVAATVVHMSGRIGRGIGYGVFVGR